MVGLLEEAGAGTLTGSVTPIPEGSDVNLTEVGTIDWVHWGLYTETSLNRKAGVIPQISDFNLVDSSNGFAYVFQYADNFNTYSWTDGTPEPMITETPTGVWAYGTPQIGSGFRFTVPADTQPRTLKVYVGAYAARGRLQAFLSDGSAPAYESTGVFNMRNGPSSVYTLDFTADSPGQTLTVIYTLSMSMQPDGNVTLQAAALTVENGNNPPTVTLTHPETDSNVAAGTDIMLEAVANDVDGSIAGVEFFVDDLSLGVDASGPSYAADWTNVAPGLYHLTAVAMDNEGATTTSPAVEVFVFGSGGSLAGANDFPPASVNLTQEGETDWIHWGYATNAPVNRKAEVTPQISPLTVLGTNEVIAYQDNYTAYAWSDGTPIAAASSVNHGVYIKGMTNGFQISAPADGTTRQLKVYVGLYGATARLQAYLSDFSAMAYSDRSLSNVYGNSYAVYTFDYGAADPGQSLIVRYRSDQLFDQDFGNVTIQAATLSGGTVVSNAPPTVNLTAPADGAAFTAPAQIVLEASAMDPDGSITRVEFFSGMNKLGESPAQPFQMTWSDVPAGDYTLTARAEDDRGAVVESAPIHVSVRPPPQPVSLINAAWAEGKFLFSFLSQSNVSYTVRGGSEFPSTNWTTTAILPGTGEIITVTNDVAPEGRSFFQVLSE